MTPAAASTVRTVRSRRRRRDDHGRSGKLAKDPVLRQYVQTCLEKRWSPEQITHQLPGQFPGQPVRHVVHETIYQALYVQGRGDLRRELTKALRTGRVRRKPHRRADSRRADSFTDSMVMITDRRARAVAGHWEGD